MCHQAAPRVAGVLDWGAAMRQIGMPDQHVSGFGEEAAFDMAKVRRISMQ